ncbi:MAG: hypothetical protein HWN81_17075, partial [Candidatus Lokiarchaeota archaeon]|nr:hypothetical protein [Candidatus Lokiarchaeota archaeon]
KVNEVIEQESQTQSQLQQNIKAKKQEKLKTKQKVELISSKLLELQEKYRQETGKRPIYNKKETKGFKEWLEKQKILTLKKSENIRKSEIKEEWELLLEKWINEANENEISKEIKEELLNIIRKYRKSKAIYWRIIQILKRKNLPIKETEEIEGLLKKLEKITGVQVEIFKNLRAFRAFYNDNIRWYKKSITAERQKFMKHLSQKLSYLKKIKKTQKVIKENWKEILKENLYKNITLSLKEKSIINQILQKEKLTEVEKKELISILSKLPTEYLISLLGNDFKKHTQNYIKWGWDFDQGVKRLMLNKFISLKENVEINKNPKTRQKLYSDEESKECGRCHQIKPYNEYGARIMGGKKILFSRCKKCRIDIKQIYQYNNKVKILRNVYNGKLKGKCQICSTDVKRLPSLEFHHKDPKLKGVKSFSLYRNWEKTKKQIEKEKATILCVNCHTKQRSKHYNNYEKIIKECKLDSLSSNNQIFQYVNNKLPNADYEARRQVTRNIKKQIVINYLYGGKCVGCRDISTKNNLPALQFHHRDKENPYKMSKTYVNLRNLETKEIIKKLKQENCITLCGNCHKMEQSTHFKNYYEKIVRPEYWNLIKKDYERIEKNIENFKFKSESNIPTLN